MNQHDGNGNKLGAGSCKTGTKDTHVQNKDTYIVTDAVEYTTDHHSLCCQGGIVVITQIGRQNAAEHTAWYRKQNRL